MRRRKGFFYPVIILAGIMAMGFLLIIFTPAIFGSMSASGGIEKYSGNSVSGNETVIAVNGVDNLVIGMYSLPANPGFIAFACVCLVIVVIVMFKLVMGKKKLMVG